jgi:hypothetical protein
MTGKKLAVVAGTMAGEIMALTGIPGGNMLSEVVKAVVDKRRREGTEILRKALENGPDGPITFDEDDVEPAAAIFLRYSKAVNDGAAKRNLRLLAQVIAGMKRQKALNVDRFGRWVALLQDMSRDEIVLLGKAVGLAASRNFKVSGTAATFSASLRNQMSIDGYSHGELFALIALATAHGLLLAYHTGENSFYEPSPWLQELAELADLDGAAACN